MKNKEKQDKVYYKLTCVFYNILKSQRILELENPVYLGLIFWM